MGLRFDPVGGGQFKEAVKAIVEAERQPIKQLEARKAREEAKMKLFQEFKGKFTGFDRTLAEFTNFKNFRELKVDLGDGAGFMNVTVDKEKAQPGSYSVEVKQLAQRSSVISNGFKDADEKNLGVGYLVFRKPDGDKEEIYVGADDASLRNVASLINAQPNISVHASVIRDESDQDNPWRLVMASKKDGIREGVEFPDVYFMDGDQELYFDERHDADNAVMKLDGFEIEAGSNKIPDFLQGVTVELKQAMPGKPITLSITEDNQKIAGKVKGLVDQMNGILEFINKQNQVDDKSDTRTTFAGDTSMQTVEFRLRNLLHEGFPVGEPDSPGFRRIFLNQIGVEFAKDGKLDFKEEKFKKMLDSDFQGVSEGITGKWGFASQLRQVMQQYTQSGSGLLATREQGFRNRIKSIDEDIAGKERRLDQKTQAIVDQFSRLQSTLSNMQRQGQYVTATLGGGGGGNMVQQLLGG